MARELPSVCAFCANYDKNTARCLEEVPKESIWICRQSARSMLYLMEGITLDEVAPLLNERALEAVESRHASQLTNRFTSAPLGLIVSAS